MHQASADASTGEPHSALEDFHALVAGSLFVALGVVLFGHAGMATGGTAGLAFLLHYASGYAFGPIFFVINPPFYVFAVRSLGWPFAVKTFIAVAMLSGWTMVMPSLIHIETVQPVFAALAGGLLAGMGLLALARHKASLGGIGVLALYLQEKHGWRAGKVQMGVDCAIVLAAVFVLDPWPIALSIFGAVAMNFVLAINHRPGRYLGF